MKKLCVVLTFVFLGLIASGVQGKIPHVAFKDMSSEVPKTILSPQLGVIAIDTGFLSNIRFFGVETPGVDANGNRDYTKDASSDPIWSMVKLLFPSPNGLFTAIANNASANLAFRLTQKSPEERIGVIIDLLTYAQNVRSGADGAQAHKLVGERLSRETFMGADLRDCRKNTLEPLLKAIEGSIAAEKASIYPQGTPEQIILAFFYDQFTDPRDVRVLTSKLREAVKPDDSGVRAKIMDAIFDDYLGVTEHNFSIMPYGTLEIISNGSAKPYNRETETFSDEKTFADCAETAMRHLVNIALYNSDPLARGFVLPPSETPYFKNLEAFFKEQTYQDANNGSVDRRSLWNAVVGDINRGRSPESLAALGEVRYLEGSTEIGQYNLKPGFINILRILELIFGFGFTEPKELDRVEDLAGWLRDSFTKFFAFVNPTLKADISELRTSLHDYYQGGGKDLFGHVALTLRDSAGQSIVFTLIVDPGHAMMRLRDCRPQPCIRASSEYGNLQGTESALLMGMPEASGMPFLYRHLKKALANDTSAHAQLIKAFADSTDRAVEKYTLFLKNVFRQFLWNDLGAYDQIKDDLRLLAGRDSLLPVMFEAAGRFPFDCSSIGKIQNFQNLKALDLKGPSRLLKQVSFGPNNRSLQSIFFHEIDSLESIEGLEHLVGLEKINLCHLPRLRQLRLFPQNMSLRGIQIISLKTLMSIEGLDRLPSLEDLFIRDLEVLRSLTCSAFNNKLKTMFLDDLNARGVVISGIDQLSLLEKFTLSNPEYGTQVRFGTGNTALTEIKVRSKKSFFLGCRDENFDRITGLESIPHLKMIESLDGRWPFQRDLGLRLQKKGVFIYLGSFGRRF